MARRGPGLSKKVKEVEKMIEEGGIYVETAKKGVVLSGYVDASFSYNLNGGGTDAGQNGTPGTIRTHQFDVDSNFLDGEGGGGGGVPDDDDDLGGGENGDDAPADFAKAITGQLALHAAGGNADLVNSFIYSFEGEDVPGLNNTLSHEFIGTGGGYYFDGEFPADGTLYYAPTGTENDGIFVWNMWGQWRPLAFKDKLLVGFDAVLGMAFDNVHRTAIQYQAAPDEEPSISQWDSDQNTATWWGIGLCAKYQVTDIFSLATRAEYFHDSDGTARLTDGIVVSNVYYGDAPDPFSHHDADSIDAHGLWVSNTDVWSWTLTAGIDLWENMLMRLEYRLDVVSSDGGGPNPFTIDGETVAELPEDNAFFNNQSTQHTFILDLSYSF